MKFTVWSKFNNAKRFHKSFETEDAKRASLVAENVSRWLCIKQVKVVCDDGYTRETLIIK